MWDVKFCVLVLIIAHSKSFIWTMWDVKAGDIWYSPLPQASFIWTMWDVKSALTHDTPSHLYQFYMNYVGCKDILNALGLKPGDIGFIWTMWDVKTITRIKSLLTVPGFIWTMWDVKVLWPIYSSSPSVVLYELCGM